ncbi:MAG: hypothetical protein ACYC5Y_05210 [Symbiobacteriia bacterium]
MIPLNIFLGALAVQGALFALILGLQTVAHGRERRELYSRLMARDLGEFQRSQTNTAPPKGGNFVLRAMQRAAETPDPSD